MKIFSRNHHFLTNMDCLDYISRDQVGLETGWEERLRFGRGRIGSGRYMITEGASFRGRPCLVKIFYWPGGQGPTFENLEKDINNEMETMKTLSLHANGAKFLGCVKITRKKPALLLLESVNEGSVTEFLASCRRSNDCWPTKKLLAKLAMGVACALLELHRAGLLHRDISRSNVLVDRRGETGKASDFIAMLTDLSFSRVLVNGHYEPVRSMSSISTWAPELVEYVPRFKLWTDSWAFGVFLWEIFHDSQVWQNLSGEEKIAACLMKIKNSKETMWNLHPISENVNPVIRNLIKECWDRRPARRPKAERIYEVLKSYYESIKEDEAFSRTPTMSPTRSPQVLSIVPQAVVPRSTETGWIGTADNLFKAKMGLRRLREEHKILSRRLQELSGGETTKQGRYEYTCSARRGQVYYAAIPQLFGVDLEPYRKPGVKTWRLEVVE